MGPGSRGKLWGQDRVKREGIQIFWSYQKRERGKSLFLKFWTKPYYTLFSLINETFLKNQLLFCISRRQDINSFWSSLPFLKDITRMGCLDIHKRNSHFYPKDNCEMTINQNSDVSDWVAGVNLCISNINYIFLRNVTLKEKRDNFFPLKWEYRLECFLKSLFLGKPMYVFIQVFAHRCSQNWSHPQEWVPILSSLLT